MYLQKIRLIMCLYVKRKSEDEENEFNKSAVRIRTNIHVCFFIHAHTYVHFFHTYTRFFLFWHISDIQLEKKRHTILSTRDTLFTALRLWGKAEDFSSHMCVCVWSHIFRDVCDFYDKKNGKFSFEIYEKDKWRRAIKKVGVYHILSKNVHFDY